MTTGGYNGEGISYPVATATCVFPLMRLPRYNGEGICYPIATHITVNQPPISWAVTMVKESIFLRR